MPNYPVIELQTNVELILLYATLTEVLAFELGYSKTSVRQKLQRCNLCLRPQVDQKDPHALYLFSE